MTTYSTIVINKRPPCIIEFQLGEDWRLAQKSLKYLSKGHSSYMLVWDGEHGCCWGIKGAMKKLFLSIPYETWTVLEAKNPKGIEELVGEDLNPGEDLSSVWSRSHEKSRVMTEPDA